MDRLFDAGIARKAPSWQQLGLSVGRRRSLVGITPATLGAQLAKGSQSVGCRLHPFLGDDPTATHGLDEALVVGLVLVGVSLGEVGGGLVEAVLLA